MGTQDELNKAFSTGDVAALATYFASDAGRARLVETERHLVRVPNPPTIDALPQRERGFNPWYLSTQGPFGVDVSLLAVTTERGHGEVIAWLFDWSQASQMRATLGSVFTHVCAAAVRANDLPIVDMLLTSRIFIEMIPDNKKHAVLHSLLQSEYVFTRSAMLALLIAHGAKIESPETLAQCAGVAELEQVELLLRNGVFVVGYEVLSEPAFKCKAETVRRLIECGADAKGGSGIALYRASLRVHFKTVSVLLKDGFADAGANTIYGQTALRAATTRVGSMASAARRGASRDTAQSTTSSSAQVRNILLQYGANPAHDLSNWQWE